MLSKRLTTVNEEMKGMNIAPWRMPLLSNKIFDARTATCEDRTQDDLFSHESKFDYLQDVQIDGVTINDSKVRDEFLDLVDQEDFSVSKAIVLLEQLCPNSFKFLSHMFFSDVSRDEDGFWDYLLRLGASMTGVCFDEAMFLVAPSGSGKTTHMKATKSIYGDWAVNLDHSALLEGAQNQNPNAHTAHLAPLVGARAAIIDEGDKSKINSSQFKKLCSHVEMNFRNTGKEGGPPVAFRLIMLFFLNFKSIPRWTLADESIRKRVVTIKPQVKTFTANSNDKPEGFDPRTWTKDRRVGGTVWKLATPEDVHFAKSFERLSVPIKTTKQDEKFRAREMEKYDLSVRRSNELGTLFCLMAAAVFRITKGNGTPLPRSAKTREDSAWMLEKGNLIGEFISCNYDIIPMTVGKRTIPTEKYMKTVARDGIPRSVGYDKLREFFRTKGFEKCPTDVQFKDFLEDRELAVILPNGEEYMRLKPKKDPIGFSTDIKTGTVVIAPDLDMKHETKSRIPDSPRSPSPDTPETPPRSSEKRKKKDSSTRSSSKHSCIRPPTP